MMKSVDFSSFGCWTNVLLLWSIVLRYVSCNNLDTFFEGLDYDVYLDEEEKFSLHWSLINDTHMEIGIVCINLGWCAMGISPNGQMPNSDINFFWIDDSTNEIYLQDRYVSTSRSVPQLDDEQNVYLISGGQTNNYSYVRYIRPQFSCDSDDNLVEIGTTRLLYAYQEDDPTDEFFSTYSNVNIHDEKGSKSVNLLTGSSFEVDLEDDVITYEILMNNYSVPGDSDTTYYCKFFQLPKTNETQHIVKFEPIITDGNEGVVHHMLAYYCPSSFVNESDLGAEEICTDYREMAIGSSDCVYGAVSYAWAIGGEAFYFPDGVGLEMSGTESNDTLQYVLLEIHYDNPDYLDTIIDSSGVRIYYTPSLRNETAALLEIGITSWIYGQFIPAGINAALNTGYCNSDCTSAGLPDSGVKIFSSVLHAHTTGIGLNLRHVRDGIELDPIDTNWAYDFDYQSTVSITDTIDFLPGDDLILDCYYNTSGRDNNSIIEGGFSTTEEMCLVYLYVYPKPKLSVCLSMFYPSELTSWVTNAVINGYANSDFDEYYINKEGALNYYKSLWNDSTIYQYKCDDLNKNRIGNAAYLFDIPTIKSEYELEICNQSVAIEVSTEADENNQDNSDNTDTDNTDTNGMDDDDSAFINNNNVNVGKLMVLLFSSLLYR